MRKGAQRSAVRVEKEGVEEGVPGVVSELDARVERAERVVGIMRAGEEEEREGERPAVCEGEERIIAGLGKQGEEDGARVMLLGAPASTCALRDAQRWSAEA